MFKKILLPLWSISSILLLAYSFTQVDLGLTLTRASFWQVIQTTFQYIGYFNRPVSTYLYIGIVFIFFLLFLLTLRAIQKNLLEAHDLWKIVIVVSAILFFSYSAFSYDIFNYIFDARIVTTYHQNPYQHKALDYPGDPMLSFMHWTHRTYPYAPFWLLLTTPLTFIGGGYFLITFYLFKALMTISYIGSVYFLEKVLKKIDAKNAVFATAFFALNPLIIIESLVSAHIDIVMVFFAMISLYFLFSQKYIKSFLYLIISFGIKFATGFVLPVYVFYILKRKTFEKEENLMILFSICMLIATVASSIRTNYQPWYLVSLIPYAAILAKKYFIVIPVVIFSYFSLMHYIPYLYFGNWDWPIPEVLTIITTSAGILSVAIILIYRFAKD